MTRIISTNKETGEVIMGEFTDTSKEQAEKHVKIINKAFCEYESIVEEK